MSSRRRVKIPETYREVWRRIFLDDVLSRPRVQNIITQDLRPLRREAFHELPNHPEGTSWRDVADQDDAPSVESPKETAYSVEISRVVRDVLRCRQADQAAPWFLKYFSAAVADRLPDGPFLPDPEEDPPAEASARELTEAVPFGPNGQPTALFEVLITLEVGPYGAAIERATVDVPDQEHMVGGEFVKLELPDPTGAWDNWEAFERAAIELLNDTLALLKTEYANRFPYQRNVATIPQLTKDAKDLARYLIDRTPLPDQATRQRLKRFADLIGLDFPVKS